jgi:hypothetical protein
MSVSPRNQTYYYSDQWHLQELISLLCEVRMLYELQERMSRSWQMGNELDVSQYLPGSRFTVYHRCNSKYVLYRLFFFCVIILSFMADSPTFGDSEKKKEMEKKKKYV